MNRYFTIFLGLFFISANLPAQDKTLAIGGVKACAGEIVLLPVTAANLTDVGAITLFIGFDASLLEYVGIENIDGQLDNINYGYNTSTGQIVIAWINMYGRNFIQSKLFDIKFRLNECTNVNVGFSPECEIATKDAQIIPVLLTGGSVIADFPEIVVQPQGIRVQFGGKATFETNASTVTEYLWKESRDGGVTWLPLIENEKYHGVNSAKLEIFSVAFTDNNNMYLCELNNKGCKVNTTLAPLAIDSVNGINNAGNNGINNIVVFPNPFRDKMTCNLTLPSEAKVKIDILDITGKTVLSLLKNFPEGRHLIELSGGFLKPGIYYCRINIPFENGFQTSNFKMIKL